MSHTPRTLVLIGVGAAVVAGLLYVSFRTDPIPVDLHIISRGPMEVTIDADGKTRIRDLYEVSAPISGTALRAPVAVGDAVVKGQTVVAVVEPVAPSLLDARTRLQGEAALQEAAAALHVAEADLVKAREDQSFAQSQHARTETLVARSVASLSQLENAAQRLAVATAGVDAAMARVDMARGTLGRIQAGLIPPDLSTRAPDACCVQILAPATGVVLSIVTVSERPVQAGAELLTIGDPQNIELVADLLSSDAVRLQPQAEARVDRWGGEKALTARLDHVEPVARTKVSALGIEEQRVDAIFELTSPIEERARLSEGFSVFLRIVEWQTDDALSVPLSAIFKRGEEWSVFVAKDGIATERLIRLGRRNNQMAEVLGELNAGEAVITHPGEALTEGSAIVDRSEL